MARVGELGDIYAGAQHEHHLVTTETLRRAGFTPEQIKGMVKDRMLERIIRGLYRIPGSRTPRQDIAAAVSRHHTAAASHLSSLYLHGAEIAPPRPPHITLDRPGTSVARLAVSHRGMLGPEDVTVRDGIRTTTLPRAVVEAAEVLEPRALRRLLDQVLGARMVAASEILKALQRAERAPGRLGSGKLRQAMGLWTDALTPESPAEAAIIRRVIEANLPPPRTQFPIAAEDGRVRFRLDLAWPDEKVCREYDSDRFHTPAQADADERRRQVLESMGWSVGVLHRGHLVPSRTDWLDELARDLGHRRAA